MKKLKSDDRCAVDLLLEQKVSGSANGWEHCFNRASDATFQKRVEGVERLFKLLDLLPATEPPASLVARTLEHIQQADRRQPVLNPAAFGSASRAVVQRLRH